MRRDGPPAQAWREHDYAFALFCIRDVLARYRAADFKKQRRLISDLVYKDVYPNLAAALEDDSVWRAINRVTGLVLPKTMRDEDGRRWSSAPRNAISSGGHVVVERHRRERPKLRSRRPNHPRLRERPTKVESSLNRLGKTAALNLSNGIVHAAHHRISHLRRCQPRSAAFPDSRFMTRQRRT